MKKFFKKIGLIFYWIFVALKKIFKKIGLIFYWIFVALKKIFKKISLKRKGKIFLFYWIFVAFLYGMQILMVNFLPQYSGLIYTLANGLAVCGALKVVEELLFPEINTDEVLSKNPIAYAIYIFAFAYILARAML